MTKLKKIEKKSKSRSHTDKPSTYKYVLKIFITHRYRSYR